MDQNYGFCKGCGKQILWTRMVSGKKMPCDPVGIRFAPASRFGGEGKDTFVTPEGIVLKGNRDPEGEKLGYISHYATCPYGNSFRRRT